MQTRTTTCRIGDDGVKTLITERIKIFLRKLPRRRQVADMPGEGAAAALIFRHNHLDAVVRESFDRRRIDVRIEYLLRTTDE